MIKKVADGELKHDIVGARWPTAEDWKDDAIIIIPRCNNPCGDHHNAAAILGKIETAAKDDRAKHAAKVEASTERLNQHHQTWFRHAERTPNHGAPPPPSGPMAFEAIPSVKPDAPRDERKQALAALMKASLSKAKGLGDLKK